MLSSLLLWSLYSAIVLSQPQCDRKKSMAVRTSSVCQTRCFAEQQGHACNAPWKWIIREETCAIGTRGNGIKYICSKDRPASAAGTKGKLSKTEKTTGKLSKTAKSKKKKKSMSKTKSKPKKKVISMSKKKSKPKKKVIPHTPKFIWHEKSSSEVSGGAISEVSGGAISEVSVPLCGHHDKAKDKMCRISCLLSAESDHSIINKCEPYAPFIVFTRTLCEDLKSFEYLCFKTKVPELPLKVIPADVKKYHLEGFVNQKTGTVNYNNNQHLIGHIKLATIAAAYKAFEALPPEGAYTIEQARWTQEERNARIQIAQPSDFKNPKFGEIFHLMKDSSYDFIVMQSDINKMRFFHEETDVRMTYPGPPPAGHSTLLTDDEMIRYQAGEKIVHFAGSFSTEYESVDLRVWSTKSGHFFPSDENADVFAAKWGLSDLMFMPAKDDVAFRDDTFGSDDFSRLFGGSVPRRGSFDRQLSSDSLGSLPSIPWIGGMAGHSSSGSDGIYGSGSSAKQLSFNNIYADNSVAEPERFYDRGKTLNADVANINWMIFVIGAIIFIILTLVCCCLYVILSVLLGIIGYNMAKYTRESVNKEEAINYESAV